MKKGYYNLLLVVAFMAAFIVYMLHLGDNVLDPGDGVKHFQTAQYAFQYPGLFLDHWGKPLFTLLTAPFAQIGFQGMIMFNVLLFGLTSWLLLKSAQLLSLKFDWLVVVFCFASPIYFWLVLSGLTEVLMATIAAMVLYLFLKEHFFWGCILLSFSLFSRPESNMIIPWYLLYLVLHKQWKYMPLLVVGPFVYSVIGYFHFDDIFWMINKHPYAGGGTYGSGELFHFVLGYKSILGSLITIAFVMGIVTLGGQLVRQQFLKESNNLKWMLLILFPVVSIVFVHSIVWWKGLQGSAGYLRVMATIVPFVSLFALLAINGLSKLILLRFEKAQKVLGFILLPFGILLVYNAFENIQIDDRLMVEQRTLVRVANWYKKEGAEKKVYYMSPYFAYQAGIDPFSDKGLRDNMKRFEDKDTPSNNMLSGEYLLWDGQFSHNEGKIPLEKVLADQQLQLIQVFKPERGIKFYDRPYSAQLFVKK